MQFHGFPLNRFIASRLLWRSGLCRFFVIRHNDYRIRFYPTAVSATMFCNPQFFAKDETVLRQILRPGDAFVDVGANVGTLSLFAARIVGPTGAVYAFEAHPQTAHYLRKNVDLNNLGNVWITGGCALGNEEGRIGISNRRLDDQNIVSNEGDLIIDMRTLDTLAPPTRIRLLKIDVEGFEYYVLQGAANVLRRTDFVYFESWERHFEKRGYTTQDVIRLLENSGFRFDLPRGYRSEKCENLLAINSRLP